MKIGGRFDGLEDPFSAFTLKLGSKSSNIFSAPVCSASNSKDITSYKVGPLIHQNFVIQPRIGLTHKRSAMGKEGKSLCPQTIGKWIDIQTLQF